MLGSIDISTWASSALLIQTRWVLDGTDNSKLEDEALVRMPIASFPYFKCICDFAIIDGCLIRHVSSMRLIRRRSTQLTAVTRQWLIYRAVFSMGMHALVEFWNRRQEQQWRLQIAGALK